MVVSLIDLYRLIYKYQPIEWLRLSTVVIKKSESLIQVFVAGPSVPSVQ